MLMGLQIVESACNGHQLLALARRADAVSRGGPSVKPVLQLEGVGKTYRRGDEQVHVLVDFDFTLDAGEFVVVTGSSGAGKSTLLHVAGGFGQVDKADAGRVPGPPSGWPHESR
jgi:ABC-type bacteriocin/lantibiotic exporter with double-glycine peptidase domain